MVKNIFSPVNKVCSTCLLVEIYNIFKPFSIDLSGSSLKLLVLIGSIAVAQSLESNETLFDGIETVREKKGKLNLVL